MLHTSLAQITERGTTSCMSEFIASIDLRNPPASWPDYMLAPTPADPAVWRSDLHYMSGLIPNSFGGVHPVAALARDMAEIGWEDQMAPDKHRPSLTRVQACYAEHYVTWRDSRVAILSCDRQRRERAKAKRYPRGTFAPRTGRTGHRPTR